MGNLAEDIINLKVGDKVYLKSYEKVKHDVCLSENSWNRFYNKLLLVTDRTGNSINNSDDDFCTLFDEETPDCIEVPIYMIASVYKKDSSKVHHPNHYNQNGMEVWDVIDAFTKDLEGAEAFMLGMLLSIFFAGITKMVLKILKKRKSILIRSLKEEKNSKGEINYAKS